MPRFEVVSPYQPTGDQPEAVEKLAQGFIDGKKFQTLLGVTGSGKTFTMANIIEKIQKPTLVIAHNKTLAAQLYNELKEFFPHNAVEYFVSYYDYYQPEAYVPSTRPSWVTSATNTLLWSGPCSSTMAYFRGTLLIFWITSCRWVLQSRLRKLLFV